MLVQLLCYQVQKPTNAKTLCSVSPVQSSLPWKVSRDFVAGTAKHLAGGLGGLSKPPPVLTVGGSGGVASPQQRSAITHDKQLDIIMPVSANYIINHIVSYIQGWLCSSLMLASLLCGPTQDSLQNTISFISFGVTFGGRAFYIGSYSFQCNALNDIANRANSNYCSHYLEICWHKHLHKTTTRVILWQ